MSIFNNINDDQFDDLIEEVTKKVVNQALNRIKNEHPSIVFATEEVKHSVIVSINAIMPAVMKTLLADFTQAKMKIDKALDDNFDAAVKSAALVGSNTFVEFTRKARQ